jgi:hypothetical protein
MLEQCWLSSVGCALAFRVRGPLCGYGERLGN